MSEIDEIVREFLAESYENLDRLDQDFVELEINPEDRERLASIFRVVHTVKGTCGFLGFSKLEAVAHAGENLLSKLRDGALKLNAEITNGLLATVDAIREMLNAIELSGNDGDNNYASLITILGELQRQDSSSAKTTISQPAQKMPSVSMQPELVELDEPIEDEAEIPKSEKSLSMEGLISNPNLEGASTAITSDPEEHVQSNANTEQGEQKSHSVSDETIRVDVNVLDKLMTLVGELVLTRNQVMQLGSKLEDPAFTGALQRLNLITTELQEGVMKTRMQPIGNAWNKFPRIVRDLAKSCGKQVRLVMEGKETELDKSLIEAIRDPLTHMVRNAVDHGIEAPDVRLEKGKSEEGTLVLKSYHEGGQVIIDIVDDGRGIDREKILKKALERNLITAAQASSMTESEITNLLFMPGFSTAEKITNVSGRGVGMDVVKTNIEKIGGTIEIISELGKGSTFKVTIPLTLAIVPALIVRSGRERYAVPQISLVELVRLEGEQVDKGIEHISGAPVYRLRGKLLPLVYLSHVLKTNIGSESQTVNGYKRVNIAVLQSHDRHFGLVVDQIEDSQEIVVKPLANILQGLSIYAGVTILGDGKAAMILDVTELAHRAGLAIKSRDEKLDVSKKQKSGDQDGHQLLVCSIPGGGKIVIPLSQVTRLEKLKQRNLERVGEKYLVQYRGEIMQLVDVARVLSSGCAHADLSQNASEDDLIDVIVYALAGKSIGLIVHRIDDIVDSRLEVQGETSRDGVISQAVIQNQIMEVLDINRVIKLARGK